MCKGTRQKGRTKEKGLDMITMKDIKRAEDLAKKSADAVKDCELEHAKSEDAFQRVHGIDYHFAGLRARRGESDMMAARASAEGEAVRASFERYQAAAAESRTNDTYLRMLVSCFKVQVKQIVGAALVEHAAEWVDKPAHYKRTHAVLVDIATNALTGAGVEGVRPYVYDNGQKGIMHDTDVCFICDDARVRFSSSQCETVGMQVRSWPDGGHDADTLYNENFYHWYGDNGHGDALAIDARRVRALARSFARDMERVERENARYNDAVNAIENKYRGMGVYDDIYRARLVRHN